MCEVDCHGHRAASFKTYIAPDLSIMCITDLNRQIWPEINDTSFKLSCMHTKSVALHLNCLMLIF